MKNELVSQKHVWVGETMHAFFTTTSNIMIEEQASHLKSIPLFFNSITTRTIVPDASSYQLPKNGKTIWGFLDARDGGH